MHFISRQKTCNECVNYSRSNILCTCMRGRVRLSNYKGFCIQLFKEYWFSMKYIVKRKKMHTFGTLMQGAFFPILSPCGYHKKEKLLINK